MKLLLILCSADRTSELLESIERAEGHGFTEIPAVRGAGGSGRHLGTRAFPGAMSLVFTVGGDEESRRLTEALRRYAASLRPGEGFQVFQLEATSIID